MHRYYCLNSWTSSGQVKWRENKKKKSNSNGVERRTERDDRNRLQGWCLQLQLRSTLYYALFVHIIIIVCIVYIARPKLLWHTYAFPACTGVRVGGRSSTPRSPGRERILPRHGRDARAIPGVQWRGDQPVGEQADQQHGVHGAGGTRHERLHEQRGVHVRRVLSFRIFLCNTRQTRSTLTVLAMPLDPITSVMYEYVPVDTRKRLNEKRPKNG